MMSLDHPSKGRRRPIQTTSHGPHPKGESFIHHQEESTLRVSGMPAPNLSEGRAIGFELEIKR